MSKRYAERTTVPVAQSVAEIRTLLLDRAGATHYGTMDGPDGSVIVFMLNGSSYRVPVKRVTEDDDAVRLTPTGKPRDTETALKNALKAEEKRVWRSVALWIKALVIAHEDGIFDGGLGQMMQGFQMLPSGDDVYTHVQRIQTEAPECLGTDELFRRALPSPGK